MYAKKLRELALQALERKLLERPPILKNDLMKRMKELASRGFLYLDFHFSDDKVIVCEVIRLLQEEGFTARHICGPHSSIVRFEW